MASIQICNFQVDGGSPLVLIAGPCSIEDQVLTEEIAVELKQITSNLEVSRAWA